MFVHCIHSKRGVPVNRELTPDDMDLGYNRYVVTFEGMPQAIPKEYAIALVRKYDDVVISDEEGNFAEGDDLDEMHLNQLRSLAMKEYGMEWSDVTISTEALRHKIREARGLSDR